MTLPAWLKIVLMGFENSTEPFMEVAIFDAIRSAVNAQAALQEADQSVFRAESAAFAFMVKRPGHEGPWGTYFGPIMTFTRVGGGEVRMPDISGMTIDSVAHWEERARSTAHPVMRARYADCVWDLKRAISQQRPSHEFAVMAIDAYMVAVTTRRFTMEMEAVQWLRRALDLSLSLNDGERAKVAVQAIFDLHDAYPEAGRLGLRMFPFDALYDRKNLLTPEQEAKIIADLETLLATTSGQSGSTTLDPHGAEAAADRLAQHYKRLGDKANVQRVIKTYGEAFAELAKDAGPMLATAWLQPVIERYEQEGLRADAERLQLIASDKGKNIESDMQTFSVPISISSDQLEEWLDALTEGDLEKSLLRLIARFIPKVAKTRELVEELRNEAPLLSMISVTRFDPEGRPVGKIGSVEEDPDGRLHEQIGRSIEIKRPFLVMAIDRIREKYFPTADDLLTFLQKSPVFAASDTKLLKDGLEAYLEGDFVKAIHVLIPRVERSLRNLLALLGIPTVKTVHRHPGIRDVKNMNDVLEDGRVQVALTEDIWRYLFVLYTDRRGGLNLRNDFAHGIAGEEVFNRAIADCVFHSLLALSLIRSAHEGQKP